MEYGISYIEHTRSVVDGVVHEDTPSHDYWVAPTMFATFEDARAWAIEAAMTEKLEIHTHTRYGNGTITRNVYEVYRDDPDNEWIDSPKAVVDALDYHPGVAKAFEEAHRHWFEFADCLESQLGYGWREAVEKNLDLNRAKARFVLNDYGTPIDFQDAYAVMADEIRQQVQDSFGDRYFTDQEFFEEYLDLDKNCSMRELR